MLFSLQRNPRGYFFDLKYFFKENKTESLRNMYITGADFAYKFKTIPVYIILKRIIKNGILLIPAYTPHSSFSNLKYIEIKPVIYRINKLEITFYEILFTKNMHVKYCFRLIVNKYKINICKILNVGLLYIINYTKLTNASCILPI